MMKSKVGDKKARRLVRAVRTRRHQASLGVSRIVVTLSGKHTYAQIISPAAKVLASASTVEVDMRAEFGKNGGNIAAAEAVGRRLAEKVKSVDIGKLGFDRGGRRYDGRIKALAEALRTGGLSF